MIPTGEFIVKIQRPLASTARVPEAVVYSEGKNFFTMLPLALVQRVFPKNTDKVFYYAEFRDGTLSLDREAPTQDW